MKKRIVILSLLSMICTSCGSFWDVVSALSDTSISSNSVYQNSSNNVHGTRSRQVIEREIAEYEKRIREIEGYMANCTNSVTNMGYARTIQQYRQMIQERKRELQNSRY